MESSGEIKKRLRELFEAQKLAVLSTHDNGQPYASLVAFAVTSDLKYFLFVTPKTTRKFANLTADPRVAFMVDSRSNEDADFHRAIAVTVTGTAGSIKKNAHPDLLRLYLARHPHLEEFVRAPTAALVRVAVSRYYMVHHFQHVLELDISS